MIPESNLFKNFFATGFGAADHEPDLYVEACEAAAEKIAAGSSNYQAFREELAAHIRDSSFAPTPPDSQWINDEWLRNIWYDAFGPEAPSGDPYPVPAEHWGHLRQTDYMIHAVKDTPEFSSPGAPAWLEARGLTNAEVRAGVLKPPAECINFRPEPEGWRNHLKDLTDRGLRDPQPGELTA